MSGGNGKELVTTKPTSPSVFDEALGVWNDREKVKRMFAPNLTNDEFDFFVSLGKGLGANPFTREIYAIKFRNRKTGEWRPASIFCGRDFYRRKAEELSEYDGHYVMVVYSSDKFSVKNGNPEHEITNFADRGKIVGAYCVVHRKNTKQPYFVFVKFTEYYDPYKDIWKNKPETMIFKVAEAQGLRGAFQGVFQGTYDESEEWRQELNPEDEVKPGPEPNKFNPDQKLPEAEVVEDKQADDKPKEVRDDAETITERILKKLDLEPTTDDLGDMRPIKPDTPKEESKKEENSQPVKTITKAEALDFVDHCESAKLTATQIKEVLNEVGAKRAMQIPEDKFKQAWMRVVELSKPETED